MPGAGYGGGVTSPPEPPPAEPAHDRRPVDTVKLNGSRAALVGGVLALVGIVLMIVGVEHAGVFIAVVAVLPTVYGVYLFFLAAPSGAERGP